MVCSIAETAKKKALDPLGYLCYLFECMPNMDDKDLSALDELLPYSPSLSDSCRAKR